MRIKQGGGASYSAGGQRYGSSQSGYSQQYQDPFSGAGFGFGPFGFGYYSTSGSSGRQSYGSAAVTQSCVPRQTTSAAASMRRP